MADHYDEVLQRQRLLRARKASGRKLEDVDYWRKRAGWADDDATMKSYNQGVYNTYYLGGDSDGSSSVSKGGSSSKSQSVKLSDHVGWIIGLATALIFLILLVKCCSSDPSDKSRKSRSSAKSRDSSRSLRDKHADRRSRSRSRARSKSRTRSKSRSRDAVEDYELMDEDDNRSRKSSRSTRSKKSSRSRSRSKARSKSRPRERKSEKESDEKMTMLV